MSTIYLNHFNLHKYVFSFLNTCFFQYRVTILASFLPC